jgi:hypothetical protein
MVNHLIAKNLIFTEVRLNRELAHFMLMRPYILLKKEKD